MSNYTSSSDIHWRPHSKKQDTILPLHSKDKSKPILNKIRYLWYDRTKRKMLLRGAIGSFFLLVLYNWIFGKKSDSHASVTIISDSLGKSTGSGSIYSSEEAHKMQDAVKEVFKESFHSYKQYGWGKDVYHPVSKWGENMGPKPLGWMIVDSLDTLILMKLDDELKDARKWVKDDLTYDFDYEVNTFETTIRMLGGLLSAYYLTNDKLYLNKAKDLGDRLIGAYDSPSGIPYASVNLKTGVGIRSHADGGASSTAEATTLQLEMKYLSFLTNDPKYWEKAEKVMEAIYNTNKPKDGLVPIYVYPETGKFRGNLIRLGSRGDSYYEYLLKQYLQTGKQEPVYWDMYKESVDGVKKHLVQKSEPNKLTYIGEMENGLSGFLSRKMDHLVCFYGGLLALGATDGLTVEQYKENNVWTSSRQDDLNLGKEITKACYMMYNQTETGLAPEIVVFNDDKSKEKDFIIKPADRHNLQRPETVESLFVLWRITKDPIYRQWGWEIFQNFVKYTKVDEGYDSINDVTNPENVNFRDNMESFWLAETLKYLYLLYEEDDNVVALDKVVLNTEAHPLPVFDMAKTKLSTGWKSEKSGDRIDVEQPMKFGNSRADDFHKFDQKMKSLNDQKNKQVPDAAPAAKPVEEQMKELVKDGKVEEPDKIEKELAEGKEYNEIIDELVRED